MTTESSAVGPLGTDETPEDEQGAVDEIRAQADAPPIDRDGDGISESEVGPLAAASRAQPEPKSEKQRWDEFVATLTLAEQISLRDAILEPGGLEVLEPGATHATPLAGEMQEYVLGLLPRKTTPEEVEAATAEAEKQAAIDAVNAADAEKGGGLVGTIPAPETVPNPPTLDAPKGFTEDGLAAGPENMFAQLEPKNPLPAHPKTIDIDGWTLPWQTGPVLEVGVNGVQADQVIGEVIRYLESVNVPPFNNRFTSLAVTDLQSAQNWLARRTAERIERGVEGTSQS